MKNSTKLGSEPASTVFRRGGRTRRHRLPVCQGTGLPRYRDRHQARQGARSLRPGPRPFEIKTYACPLCRGFHLEKLYQRDPITAAGTAPEPEVGTASTGSRRYVLFDVENLTHGAKATSDELAILWSNLLQHTPGITHQDHVVVGAACRVARKYRTAVDGTNVRWVVGADAPDGADRALLAAVDLRRVARQFDELLIMSGDHAFAQLAGSARALGLSVHVVTAQHPDQRSMLSRELSVVADILTVVHFEPRRLKQDKVTTGATAALQTTRHRRVEPTAA